MAKGFSKFEKGVTVVPKTPLTSDSMGELEVNSLTGELNYHDGSTRSVITTNTGSDVLINKTIDADLNTITNIDNGNIKAGAAIDRSKLASGSPNHVVINDGSGVMSSEAQLAITRGGTGQATALAAFNALSPLTTKGDLLTRDTSNNIRVPVGTDGFVLTADSAQTAGVKWAASQSAPDQSYEVSNLSIACSVGASALTIALKDKAGSDPSAGSSVRIGFRNATSATGTYNQRLVTAALSMVVSSGSTLGTRNATAQYLYVYVLDNAGTVELAISATKYDDGSVQSTSAEGGAGAADSNSTIYSTTARSNVPIRLIGRLNSTQTTAGTWAAVPTEISLLPFEIGVVAASFAGTATTSVPSNGTGIQIGLTAGGGTLEFDTSSSFSNGTFTCPVAGLYKVGAGCSLDPIVNNGRSFGLKFKKNGTTIHEVAGTQIGATASTTESDSISGSVLISAASGDTLTVFIQQDNAGSLGRNMATNFGNHVSTQFVQFEKLMGRV